MRHSIHSAMSDNGKYSINVFFAIIITTDTCTTSCIYFLKGLYMHNVSSNLTHVRENLNSHYMKEDAEIQRQVGTYPRSQGQQWQSPEPNLEHVL